MFLGNPKVKYWAQQGKVEQYFFYWEGGTWGYPDKKMEHGLLKVAHLCLICLSAGALPSAAAAMVELAVRRRLELGVAQRPRAPQIKVPIKRRYVPATSTSASRRHLR
jgi:hypothetical protein